VDFAGGNFRLASNSPYKNAGTDGKDIGCDFDAIEGGEITPPPVTTTEGNKIKMLIYPNPCNIRTSKIKIASLTTDCIVKIYNSSGELMRTLDTASVGNMGTVVWDGKNEKGEDTPMGIYLAVAYDNNGNKGITKICLLK
jgi:hypothetical protein